MIDWSALVYHAGPYHHWIGDGFLSADAVRAINAAWPAPDAPGWYVETAGYVRKSALMFPRRLPEPAQRVAEALYTPQACARLSALVGFGLVPDPWFVDGPHEPRLGGGLHDIGPGGLLKVHCDFDRHPSGLRRAANLLIYLNEGWQPEWGGALELHYSGKPERTDPKASILPIAGRAAFFASDGASWHGHPHPLACPPDRSRRSLALYYYRTDAGPGERATTLYRK